MSGRAVLLSLDCSTLPLIYTLYRWVLSKDVSSTIFKVFGMTRPGIENRHPRPLANTTHWANEPVKLSTIVESYPKAPFQYLLHRGVGRGATPFPGLLYFTLDTYLILVSVKQGGIKYHFKNLCYDATWEWTQVSWTIGELYPLVQYISKVSKVGDRSRGWLEGSLFNSYYTEV